MKLKPCPFCGGKSFRHCNYKLGRWTIKCGVCELETLLNVRVKPLDKQEKKWNKRGKLEFEKIPDESQIVMTGVPACPDGCMCDRCLAVKNYDWLERLKKENAELKKELTIRTETWRSCEDAEARKDKPDE